MNNINHTFFSKRLARLWPRPGKYAFAGLMLCALAAPSSSVLAQKEIQTAQRSTDLPYSVVAETPRSLTLEIHPTFAFDTVLGISGEKLVRVSFQGSSTRSVIGEAEIPELTLPFLSNVSGIRYRLASATYSAAVPIKLAPVPSIVGEQPRYEFQSSNTVGPAIVLAPVDRFRNAYVQNLLVPAAAYDRGNLILLESATITVEWNAPNGLGQTSPTEASFMRSLFLNGSASALYNLAAPIAKTQSVFQLKGNSPTEGETWLSIETDGEGVYRISAEDLTKAGVTGAIDPATIQIFGNGGKKLTETVTDSSGEWRQLAIDVRTSGSSLSEIYFYATGPINWKYQSRTDKLYGLYHTTNPYYDKGHYVLRVGGGPIGAARRIITRVQDNQNFPSSPTVFTATVHEDSRSFEYSSVSREMLGEVIPRQPLDPLQIALSAPGYTGDSTLLRVGFDSRGKEAHAVEVSINGQQLESIPGRNRSNGDGSPVLTRTWDVALSVPASMGQPNNLSLRLTSASTSDIKSWLNWTELFYRRSTDVGSESIPFLTLENTRAAVYNFSNAAGGGVWDVTLDDMPIDVGVAAGASITAAIDTSAAFRQWIAFSAASAKAPKLAAMSAPSLRQSIGELGATDIIIAPEAFLQQAKELKAIREKGGQATEPMSAEVVSLEQIYKEFGYGSRDLTAIRDFVAYTFRHTSQSKNTTPLFITLYGGGHADYQNRVTDLPIRIPVYENQGNDNVESMRTYVLENYPDDGFFVRVIPRQLPSPYPDLAVGRVVAQSVDDAETFIRKLKTYEYSSAEGDWRGRASFVADDRIYERGAWDPLTHFSDTEHEIQFVPTRVRVNKIYETAYPFAVTSKGYRRVGVEEAIIDAFNSGSVLISFIGHGNPNVWTHEAILTVPATINKFNNADRLAFLTVATCDFGVYDNFTEVSGGVQMFTRPTGGVIGGLMTSRSIYGDEPLVYEFYKTLLTPPDNVQAGSEHVGTALVAGKLRGSLPNSYHFYIIGDPALCLLIPKLYTVIDSINTSELDNDPMTVRSLSQLRISGRITDKIASTATESNFDGVATVTLFDAATRVTKNGITLSDKIEWSETYNVDGPILYRGKVSVKNGRFSASFVVPKDIKFDTSAAMIVALAYATDGRSALGSNTRLHLAGPDQALIEETKLDTVGPDLAVYLGNRRFRSGDVVATNSNLIVDVSDLHGLNTSSASIGHSFVGWVDDHAETLFDLSESYAARQDDYRVGTASQRVTLPAGKHVLHVRAFDALNNPRFAKVEFIAKDAQPLKLYNLSNYPNPVRTSTTFSVTQPGSPNVPVSALLTIFTIDHRKITELRQDNVTNSTVEFNWTGTDSDGFAVANGAYLYDVVIEQPDGTVATAQSIMIVQR